jgi:hypothetical protein
MNDEPKILNDIRSVMGWGALFYFASEILQWGFSYLVENDIEPRYFGFVAGLFIGACVTFAHTFKVIGRWLHKNYRDFIFGDYLGNDHGTTDRYH